MTQFRSVNYICLMYKLKFLWWTCPIFWELFMTSLQHLYLELYLLVILGDYRNLFFWWKILSLSNIQYSFYPINSRTGSRKRSITQEWLVIEGCLTLHWERLYSSVDWFQLYSLISMARFLPEVPLTVMLKGQPPKFKSIL